VISGEVVISMAQKVDVPAERIKRISIPGLSPGNAHG
jgi:hypothetical protein